MKSRKIEFKVCANANGCTIVKYNGEGGDVVIPGVLSVNGSELPVTEIGDGAFADNYSVESVTLPDSVEKIGSEAFRSCIYLERISSLENVREIGEQAFESCCITPGLILFDHDTKCYGWAGSSQSCEYVVLPGSVTEICNYAFCHSRLSHIVLPNGLQKIGEYAFSATDITEITIPESVTFIGEGAFEGVDTINITDHTPALADFVKIFCGRKKSVCTSYFGKTDEYDMMYVYNNRGQIVRVCAHKGEDLETMVETVKSHVEPKALQLVDDTEVALDLDARENVFILLDTHKAFMAEGHAFPTDEIVIFRNYEDAKEYIDQNGIDRFDKVYPVGVLEKGDKFTNLKNMLAIADALGVEKVVLDGSYYFPTGWFLKCVGVTGENQFCVRLTSQESAALQTNSFNVPVRFNPVDIYNYSNPFVIDDERKEELNNAIFSPKGSTTDEVLESLHDNTLHENCFSQMLLRAKYLPMAIQRNDQNMVSYFGQLQQLYAAAISFQLDGHDSLFVLCDKNTHEVFVRDSPIGDHKKLVYVAYTDLFKYQGPCAYLRLRNLEALRQILRQYEADGLVVTDGPSTNAFIDLDDVPFLG